MQRFEQWIGMAAMSPPEKIAWNKVIDVACSNGRWRCRAVLFIYQSRDWTVFEDQTGYLSTRTSDEYLELAGLDELVLAGYNDSIPSGHLIVIQQGQVIREFRDDNANPDACVDRGRLDFEDFSPIRNWIGAASYVDDDEVVCSPDSGFLWMFGERELSS